MGRTVSLRGDAAKAFILAYKGVEPKTEDEALQTIATLVCMEVKGGSMQDAVRILKLLLKEGPMETGKLLTAPSNKTV